MNVGRSEEVLKVNFQETVSATALAHLDANTINTGMKEQSQTHTLKRATPNGIHFNNITSPNYSTAPKTHTCKTIHTGIGTFRDSVECAENECGTVSGV